MRRREKEGERDWDTRRCRQDPRHADYFCIEAAKTAEDLSGWRGTFRGQATGNIPFWPPGASVETGRWSGPRSKGCD